MKIHVLGIPHTQTNELFTTCAFTQKALNLCKMMHRRGHEVYHYGVEGSVVECTEHISVVNKEEWEALYPHPGTGYYNLETGGIYAAYHAKWAQNCHLELAQRVGKPMTEIIALTWGGTQRTACEGIQQFLVESGIGYKHSWSDFRVYESYAWLHMHMGAAGHWEGGKWYWAVIPNAFDLNKFTFNANRGEDFLYLGRLNADKGVGLAVHVAKEVGRKITICGQGDPTPFLNGNPHASYLPPVGVEDRRRLLSQARAVFCPSIYVEPFCGTNVEAQLSGAPVITSDFGVFPETVVHGKTGFRCRSFEQFVWAAKNIDKISPVDCREWAGDNFSLERVALMYEEFFQQILNVGRREGFYLPNPNRTQLDWLNKDWDSNELNLDRAHEPPPDGPTTGEQSEWEEAQHWERGWWGLEWGPHWDEELKKQETYFRLMGIPENRDFGAKEILDVGCGPVSLLQRSTHGPSRGVDPLAVSAETLKRYTDANVEFLNIKAEEMPEDKQFDEIWMYNCLQHTDDPDLILQKIARLGKTVRIFEWVDLGVCPGHPQNLTESMFLRVFGGPDWERHIWNIGELRDFGGTVTNKYLAIHATRR
jgi:glycosyltransferase involved in cell wall biosynthesis/SAM-dependent methyltransferase